MSDSDTIDRLIAVGRPDLAERLKHLAGKHNQARHGWRFAKGGGDWDRLHAARRSMRGQSAEERDEYRKRAGMSPLRNPNPNTAKKRGTKEEVSQIENILSGGKTTWVEVTDLYSHGRTRDPEKFRYHRVHVPIGPARHWYREVVRGGDLNAIYDEYVGLGVTDPKVAKRARAAVEKALQFGAFRNV